MNVKIGVRNAIRSYHESGLKPLIVAGTILPALMMPPTLSAQENEESEGIDEIVVTALKRETSLQDTAMAISAISGDELQKLGAVGIEDFTKTVPGLELMNRGPSERRPIVRGINGPGEAQVGLYYDEIPFSGSPGTGDDAGRYSPDMHLFDIERVEVLRGPQGTLYGSGSMGGTIRLITKRPDASGFEGAIGATVASVSHGGVNFGLRGMVNIPLAEDKLAFRLVGYSRNNDGFIDNSYLEGGLVEDINHEKATGGRAQILWTPTDSFSVRATYMTEEVEGGARFHVTDGHANGEWWSESDSRDTMDDQWDAYNVTLEWAGDDLNLMWSSSVFDRDLDYWRNGTVPSIMINVPQTSDSESHEARLVWTGLENLTLTAGAFTQERYAPFESRVVTPDPITGYEAKPTVWIFGRFGANYFEQDAVFAEGTYNFGDRFSVTAGLRWFEVSNRNENTTTNLAFLDLPPAVLEARGWGLDGSIPPDQWDMQVGESTSDDVIGKFQVDFRPNDNMLLYGVYSEGFRSGSTNQVIEGVPDIPPGYEPDKVKNYEIGLKSSWMDNRLTLNASVYHIDWENLQVQQQTANELFSFKGNAGAAEIRGVEVELNYLATDNLEISANLGLLPTAELSDDQPQVKDPDTGEVTDLRTGQAGDRIPNTPEFTGAVAATYTRPMGNGKNFVFRADLNYTDEHANHFRPTFLDTDGNSSSTPNDTYKVDDSYSILNLRAGIEGERWSADFFVRNVTDEMAISATQFRTPPPPRGWSFVLPPRTVGFSLDYSF